MKKNFAIFTVLLLFSTSLFAQDNAPAGSIIIYATSAGQTAADGDGQGGHYSYHNLLSE